LFEERRRPAVFDMNYDPEHVWKYSDYLPIDCFGRLHVC